MATPKAPVITEDETPADEDRMANETIEEDEVIEEADGTTEDDVDLDPEG